MDVTRKHYFEGVTPMRFGTSPLKSADVPPSLQTERIAKNESGGQWARNRCFASDKRTNELTKI